MIELASGTMLDIAFSLATIFVLTTFVICTAIGNVFVIVAILTDKNLRSSCNNNLVLSLAFADLLVSIFVMPFAGIYQLLDKWTFGILLCDIWTSADVFCCTGERLLASHPQAASHKKLTSSSNGERSLNPQPARDRHRQVPSSHARRLHLQADKDAHQLDDSCRVDDSGGGIAGADPGVEGSAVCAPSAVRAQVPRFAGCRIPSVCNHFHVLRAAGRPSTALLAHFPGEFRQGALLNSSCALLAASSGRQVCKLAVPRVSEPPVACACVTSARQSQPRGLHVASCNSSGLRDESVGKLCLRLLLLLVLLHSLLRLFEPRRR